MNPFFQLLRFTVGSTDELPIGITSQEWADLLEMSVKQSVAGVVFSRIEALDKDKIGIPLDVLLDWVGFAEQVKGQSDLVNKRCVEVSRYFERHGFRCCILKGQGNALMYPNPLMRTSGDIDLWLIPQGDRRKKSDEVLAVVKKVRKLNPTGKICYHHVDAGKYKDVDVEAHYRPSFMNNLIYNRRMQQWFDRQVEKQFSNSVLLPEAKDTINVPDVSFNIVFQMAHLSNHIMHDGIGVRQMMDYYYVLRQAAMLTDAERRDAVATIRHLGLSDVAGAVMYVLREVFAMDESSLLVPVDEWRGRFLLTEMMEGGSFGHYDTRTKKPTSQWEKNWLRLKRDLRLMRYFPSECLWEPLFRWYHFFWRQLMELKLKTSYR